MLVGRSAGLVCYTTQCGLVRARSSLIKHLCTSSLLHWHHAAFCFYTRRATRIVERGPERPPLCFRGRQSLVILLARGQVGVFVLRPDWQLNGEGMAEVVDNMEGWLRQMLGGEARLPRVLFTDRGTGMHSPGGKIVRCYEKALKRSGWRPFFGSDAGLQAPDMGDMLLHETGVRG